MLDDLPKFTALTNAASMVSTLMAVSVEAVSAEEITSVLLTFFDVTLERFNGLLELAPLLVCCAERMLIDRPRREINAVAMRFFFMDELFFHPEHSLSGGDISLRRHYPDQVGGYNLSALLEAPRMMRQR